MIYVICGVYMCVHIVITVCVCAINRKIHSDDHIVETTALPDHLIHGAGGQVAFEESGMRVRIYII